MVTIVAFRSMGNSISLAIITSRMLAVIIVRVGILLVKPRFLEGTSSSKVEKFLHPKHPSFACLFE